MLELRDYETRNALSEGILDCPGGRTSECTRVLENSVVYHHMNSPGALNIKVGVKTSEHDCRREHCISREPPGYYFGKRVLLPECSSRWPWSDVFSTWTLLPGAASTKGCWTFFLRKRLYAVRNYYRSKRFIARNKAEKPSDESPTDQEHSPGDRADQVHRAQLIARSIISFGCLSLVKSVFVFVYCFIE